MVLKRNLLDLLLFVSYYTKIGFYMEILYDEYICTWQWSEQYTVQHWTVNCSQCTAQLHWLHSRSYRAGRKVLLPVSPVLRGDREHLHVLLQLGLQQGRLVGRGEGRGVASWSSLVNVVVQGGREAGEGESTRPRPGRPPHLQPRPQVWRHDGHGGSGALEVRPVLSQATS